MNTKLLKTIKILSFMPIVFISFYGYCLSPGTIFSDPIEEKYEILYEIGFSPEDFRLSVFIFRELDRCKQFTSNVDYEDSKKITTPNVHSPLYGQVALRFMECLEPKGRENLVYFFWWEILNNLLNHAKGKWTLKMQVVVNDKGLKGVRVISYNPETIENLEEKFNFHEVPKPNNIFFPIAKRFAEENSGVEFYVESDEFIIDLPLNEKAKRTGRCTGTKVIATVFQTQESKGTSVITSL